MRSSVRFAASFFLPICFLLSCSSGGGGGETTGAFQIVSTNLIPGQSWPINGALEIRFNKPVNLSTVNFGTIAIVPAPPSSLLAPSAGPAQGAFFAKSGADGSIVMFQPSCPVDAANQTGGLLPGNQFGNVIYTLAILGGSGPQATVRAMDGTPLSNSYAASFQTFNGYPFLDPVPQNAPRPFDPKALPESLGLNLAIDPLDPIVVVLDQPVKASTVNDASLRLEFLDPSTGLPTAIPCSVTLSANCTQDNRSVLTLLPLGILPPGRTVTAFLSQDLEGLGEADRNAADLPIFVAEISPVLGVPQLDAFLEEFDDDSKADTQIDEPVPLAIWKGGRLEAAPMFPVKDNGIEIEIGPGTQNGDNVVFSTETGTLKDKNGTSFSFAGGFIDCSKFTIKTPLAGKSSSFRGTGANPLVIRAVQGILVEAGALLSVNGQNAPDVSGLNTPNLPAVGGPGICSGGSGGAGSPATDQSDAKGADGNGPFELPKGGGEGGHSGYGSTGTIKNRPGGGGGGNWGVFERDGLGNPIAFCYFPTPCSIPGCPQPLVACGTDNMACKVGATPVPTTQGEPGALGVITALDAFLGIAPALGGLAGPIVFPDGNPANDFLGRKALGSGGNLSGELLSLRGGQGAGGGGDSVNGTVFPSDNFLQTDTKGAGGGGGAGVLVLASQGSVVIRGTVSADGGGGGAGEESTAGSVGGAGGGGGAGGMIVIQSASKAVFGLNAKLSARGGQRGSGGGQYPGSPSGCASGSECIKNCTASRGGAGGMGVIQVHVPLEGSTTANCLGLTQRKILPGALAVEVDVAGTQQNIFCEADPAFSAKFAPNNPHVLIPDFGADSSLRSLWLSTGWASVAGAPGYSFSGADGQGSLDPGIELTLASGSGGENLAAHSVRLQSALLADAFRSQPKALLRDGFRAQSSGTVFSIVSASILGNEITLGTDPAQGALPLLGDWQILRRSFGALNEGVASGFPAGAEVSVLFEGADELKPGSHLPDLSSASLVGPTADLTQLAGKKLLRYRVHFRRSADSGAPGLEFLKIGVGF